MFAIGPVEDEADAGKEGEDKDSPAAALKTPRTTSDYYESSSFNPPSNEHSQRFEDVLTFACPFKSSGESIGDRQFIVPIGNAGDILIDATGDVDEGNATTTSDNALETVIISDRVRLVCYSNNEISYRVHARGCRLFFPWFSQWENLCTNPYLSGKNGKIGKNAMLISHKRFPIGSLAQRVGNPSALARSTRQLFG